MSIVGVTGATSPLGIHLVDALAKRGHRVYAGYRFRSTVPFSWWESQSIQCVQANIEEYARAGSAFLGCDIIIWLAHIQQQLATERQIELNLGPFEWFCGQRAQIGFRKLIFVSSGGSVYGEPKNLPIPEDHPRNPLSAYGKAKKNLEDSLLSYSDKKNLDVGILRPGNIYGPESFHGKGKGVIGAFYRSLISGQPFTLINKGSAIRDFVHVYDVTRAILSAMETNQNRVVWNVATGIGHRVSDVLKLICEVEVDYPKPQIVNRPARIGDVQANILSIRKIRAECLWKPRIRLEQGIRIRSKVSRPFRFAVDFSE